MKRKTITFAFAMVVAFGSFAETYTWAGPENGKWHDEANWKNSAGVTGVGYPTYGDKAVVRDAVIHLEISVQVEKLALSGTVTVYGPGRLDVAGDPYSQGAYVSAAGGTYTFDCLFLFSNKISSSLEIPSGGTTYFNRSFKSDLERLKFGGGGTIHLGSTDGKSHAIIGLLMVGNAVLHIHSETNYFKRVEIDEGGRIEIDTDNPWDVEWMRQHGTYSHMKGSGVLDLNGHDVEFSPMLILGSQGCVMTVLTDADSPAVFAARDTKSTGSAVVRTNSTCNMTGPVTYRLSEGSTGTVALDRLLDLSGGVEVLGGVLDCTVNAAFPDASHLSIANGAKVRLAEGLCLVVPALYLDGAAESVEGGKTYGAEGSGADVIDNVHFTGKGRVLVLDTSAEGVTRTLIADGNWTDKANWSPEGYPHPQDNISIADRTLNLDQPLCVDSVKLGGTAASVTGKRLTLLNASSHSAYSSASGGTYTWDAELVFRYPTTEVVSMYGTTYFRGGLTFNDRKAYFYPSYGTVHFQNQPVNIYRCVPNHAATLYLDVPNNGLGRVEAGKGVTYHITVDDPWLTEDIDYVSVGNNGTVHLHGHDIHVPNWLCLGSNATTGYGLLDTDPDKPATVSVLSTKTAQSYVRTNSIVDIAGPVTLKLMKGSVTRMILDRAISSTGSLIVDGSVFEMTENGTWANALEIAASGSGKIIVNNGHTFNRQSTVWLESAANLEIASPVVQRVKSLYIGGVAQRPGFYSFGAGQLQVMGEGFMIILK